MKFKAQECHSCITERRREVREGGITLITHAGIARDKEEGSGNKSRGRLLRKTKK